MLPVSNILSRSRLFANVCFCDIKNASPARMPNASTFPNQSDMFSTKINSNQFYHN